MLQGSDELAAIDLSIQQVKWIIPASNKPAGVYMTPDNQYLLVSVIDSDYVVVVDWRTQKIVKKILTGDGAHNFRLKRRQSSRICLQACFRNNQYLRSEHVGKRWQYYFFGLSGLHGNYRRWQDYVDDAALDQKGFSCGSGNLQGDQVNPGQAFAARHLF